MNKSWLIIAIFTLVTILSWVIFDTIHTRTQTEVPQELQEVIEPINPNLNTEGL